MNKYLKLIVSLTMSLVAFSASGQNIFGGNESTQGAPLGGGQPAIRSGPLNALQGAPDGAGAEGGTAPSPGAPPVIFGRPKDAGPTGLGSQLLDSRQQIKEEQTINATELRDRLQYQDFVLRSTGKDLPLFGSNLFRNTQPTFLPSTSAPVTPDYVIGPGDEIQIRAWGQVDVDLDAVVDRNGSINVPKVGVLNVSGLKYQDLTSFLNTAFRRVFRNFELTATLGRLRSIQIFVVGQARRPGTYTVSSLSTLVTALFSAGGPSSKGSMRSIQLKRGNTTVADLDLYDLLVSGDKSKDSHLLPGDVIYIPAVGPLVAINGSVNGPAIFELKGEEKLSEVLTWAGGLATTAQGRKVTVERIDQRRVRSVDEFSLDRLGLSKILRDGDLVTVFEVSPQFDNAVTLRGNVAQPGRFPWREGMRIKDLIPSREALISREYWDAQNQTVGLDSSIERILQQQELSGTRLRVNDLLERTFRDENTTVGESIRLRQIERDATRISTDAQARETVGRDRRIQDRGSDRARLLNQIAPSLKEVNWEYALIERKRPVDLTVTLVPFNLAKAVIENDPQSNLLLQPGDIVTIFSKEDLQVPQGKQTKFIRLEGEVAAPGIYQVEQGETLRQLIVRVGGFTANAYPFGAEFTRESTRIQQQRTLDEVINRMERDIQRFSLVRSQNNIAGEDANVLKQQTDQQLAFLTRLRQLRATGRVVLELSESSTVKDLPNLPLEDSDRLYIPAMPSMVTVLGAVYNENSFIYRPEKRFTDYLAQAGGTTKDADQASVYVLRADGSVMSSRQSGGFFSFAGRLDGAKLLPGDSVVVPEELDRTSWIRNLKDYSQILYQFGLGAAALKILTLR